MGFGILYRYLSRSILIEVVVIVVLSIKYTLFRICRDEGLISQLRVEIVE